MECICCDPGETCRGFCRRPSRVTYASEAEARADWLTINPEFRTEAMLAEMLARVAPHSRT
jgi:hypothetical protein